MKTRIYLPHVKKYWYCFLLGPLFMILEASGEFILPSISAKIIDEGAANRDLDVIFRYGGYMLVIALGMMLTGVLGAFFSIRGSARLAAGVRKDTFRRIQSFSFSNIDDFTTGSLITRITNDVTQVQNFAQTLLRGFFRAPVMLIGALLMSFYMNPRLAAVILAVVPLLACATAIIILTASGRYTKMQKQLDVLNSNVRETVTNEKVIKSFATEEQEKSKFALVNEQLSRKTVKALKMMILMQPVSALAINLTTVAVVWFAGRQIMVNDMTVGTLTAFITYLSQILTALNFVANIVLQGARAKASSRRIREIFNAEIPITDKGADPDAVIENGDIVFEGVKFKYYQNNARYVLDGIDLSVKSGQTVGIIGSTGSGKTTLISLIPRLYDATEGRVTVGGRDVKTVPSHVLREKIAVVLQKNTLFSGTVAENLRWGNPDASDEQLEAACRIAQAHGFISAMPEGYQTRLVRGGQNLSGGQKQRLCIARALLKNPAIIILDDSTSAVDTATDAAIRREFAAGLKGTTKLIIAQRINSVIDADMIVVMDDGRIVGSGTHDELIENCEAYREIYWSQKDPEDVSGHCGHSGKEERRDA